ncbi:MAG: hypothetical protein AAFV28_07800 [Cyanobacteria bacterium J06635_13]
MKLLKLPLNIVIISLLFSVIFKSKAVVCEPPQAPQKKQLKSLGKEKFSYGNNITHQLVGSRIVTQFAPQNSQGESLDLNTLAVNLGYQHFNWASYVVEDPYGIQDRAGQQLTTPYNDPPKGGYLYDQADSLPFYWDLEKCRQCQPRHHWQNQHNFQPYYLVFEDSPVDYRLQPGEAIEFITNLVGIKHYDLQKQSAEWEILHTFRWQLTGTYPNVGKVTLIDADVGLDKLSPVLLNKMQLDGAIFVVDY